MTTHATDVDRHGSGPDDLGATSLAELDANPYPIYRRLRDEGVVWVRALERWMVTRWDDVGAVETAKEDFSADESNSNLTRVIGRQMLRSDGAEHRRRRSAAQDPLRPDAAAARRESFQRIADRIVDRIAERGEADLFTEFAAPFAGECLAEILGLPDAGADDMARWSTAILNGSSNYGGDPATWETAMAATREVDAAVDAAIDGAGAPAGTILGAMAASDGALLREELRANVKIMIGGGYNEPRDAIGTALWGLLAHPDQLETVRADPALWPRVVEEANRWVAPIGVAPREVRRTVTIGETTLEPGARVMVNFASANRDERHWERPDRFDVLRPKTRNVAFGVGHHFCLGVWMARTQVGAVALPTLLERLPNLRLDHDRPPTQRGWVFRGPTQLHARWDPAS